MSDYSKLKELAEAAGGVHWEWWTSNSTLRLTSEKEGRHGSDGDAISAYQGNVECPEKYRAFIEVASPAAVMQLTSELSRATADKDRAEEECGWHLERVCQLDADIDLLKAENERLREAHEQVCTNYNRASYASEERGKQIDQLKAKCEGLREKVACVDDLSALVRQLVHRLRKAAPDNDLPGKAMDYLKRKGLQGSPLRSGSAGVDPVIDTPNNAIKWTAEDEAGSKVVYEQWANLYEYVPWVEGGNSLKQDEARRLYAAIEGKVYCYGR
ncbi:hypothetical protein [Pseudomonas syringae]|uniref:Uncharacterized protein n=1 Tax=Pseudomonas syringae TaxID=317 RepID=A0A085V3W2_PSESX|nr:hypothetical protein [Pseudomonas syringae]KFE50125.1 hypothetical protein IV01_25955 [Pseudomonas syringae]